MANDAYNKALKEILTDDSPARPTEKTREEIETEIAAVSKRLQGPLNNVERLWLVEDKRELRKQLAAVTAP
jgi:hypothetical protein